MNYARQGFGLVSVGGLLYAVGGRGREAASENAPPARLSSAEMFDPSTGEWTVLADLPAVRSSLALVHVRVAE